MIIFKYICYLGIGADISLGAFSDVAIVTVDEPDTNSGGGCNAGYGCLSLLLFVNMLLATGRRKSP